MLIGALLRVPAQASQRRIIRALNAAGFDELKHAAYGSSPISWSRWRSAGRACHARRHQQSGDEPVGSLEDSGYLLRDDAPEEGGGRVVRFTRRGHAAYERVHDILRNIKQEWTAALGAEDFTQLKSLLARVWDSRFVN